LGKNAFMFAKRDKTTGVLSRRRFLRAAVLAGAAGFVPPVRAESAGDGNVTMPFANGDRRLVKFPQKRELLLVTMRPPQLETPFSVFNEGLLTPNDAFFVRYHLAQVPTSIDLNEFRLTIKGKVNSLLALSLDDLKAQFEPVELVAVNQCSGNGRAFSNPRVAGGQLGNGAMGCARWKGVRLKDVLNKAGVAGGARQVTFNGLDQPVSEKTPDFVKALEVDHALDGETMLAYEMNGEPLPMLNGYPLRLVVPGYYGTYWVKHLHEITVLDEEFAGFWMKSAYLIPDNAGACVEPGAAPSRTRPIGRYNVRSFITSLTDGDRVEAGQRLTVRGIAFDGGYGIAGVRFSDDGGQTWREATLGRDLGKYAFREWTIPFAAMRAGTYELKACAFNRIGQSQPIEPLWNPPGYMRNVVETVRVTAA
jgi:DMSO/TMAO reductase YedYZ molybdopterin-dependent catalytic subunit